jgi:hypothetical protein
MEHDHAGGSEILAGKDFLEFLLGPVEPMIGGLERRLVGLLNPELAGGLERTGGMAPVHAAFAIGGKQADCGGVD